MKKTISINIVKTVMISFLLMLTVINCSTFDSEDELIKINKLLNNWHDDAKEAKLDNYINLIDLEGFYIGTDASEIWTKKEFESFSKPYFEKKQTWDFKTINRNIHFSKNNDVVWFNELLDTWMGKCRGSGILEKVNGKWKIKQYVLSVTIPNSKMSKVIKIKKSLK